jgi:hypothetical protein
MDRNFHEIYEAVIYHWGESGIRLKYKNGGFLIPGYKGNKGGFHGKLNAVQGKVRLICRARPAILPP